MPISSEKTISFTQREMEELRFLKPGAKETINLFPTINLGPKDGTPVDSFDTKEMYKFTRDLMRKLMINYRGINNLPREELSDEVKRKLRPYASFLAMLDGNDFEDLIEQYTPEAYALITGGGRINLDQALENMAK